MVAASWMSLGTGRSAATRAAIVCALALVTCKGTDELAAPSPPEAAGAGARRTASTPSAGPVSDSARACGEAGPTPIDLPPRLARGLAPVGRGLVRPGETIEIDRLTLTQGAWIGGRVLGDPGPTLTVLLEDAAPEERLWAAQQPLAPGAVFRVEVGPFRVDGRVVDAPAGAAEVVVTRDACPDAQRIEPASAPVWFWASTEAIRIHTLEVAGAPLVLTIEAHDASPRVELRWRGYHHAFAARPGPPRIFHVADRRITVDAVTPGRETAWDDGWRATEVAHVHARVRIDAVDPGAPPAQGDAEGVVRLSTRGDRKVVVGDPGAPALTLEIDDANAASPRLVGAAEGSSYAAPITREDAGYAFSLGEFVVEIVDVIAGPGAPAVQVQLRITAP